MKALQNPKRSSSSMRSEAATKRAKSFFQEKPTSPSTKTLGAVIPERKYSPYLPYII